MSKRNHRSPKPRSVVVNHARLWILRRRFESSRGYFLLLIAPLVKAFISAERDFKTGKMTLEIRPVFLGRIIGNCYIVKTDTGFILIDTGRKSKLAKLEKELDVAGCKPGNLNLIILTHGDFDHTGNCALLREKFGTKIAMHPDDIGMVERGDMFWNRKTGNFLMRLIVNVLFRIRKFKPDLTIGEGYDLSEYGFNAKVLSLPGHSKGSIGILTAGGDLFCGDLFSNIKKPELNSILDDLVEANASVDRLKEYEINTVYPGHGTPFPMSSLTK
jgi:hydroxyacylglutathione hydrolase